MSKELKAIEIFAGMIALPIVADNLISRKPDIRLFPSFEWPWQLTPVLILVIAAIAVIAVYDMIFGRKGILKKFEDDIGQIQGWVRLAERELLTILRAWDQTGRMSTVSERAEWASMANPTINHSVKGDLSSTTGEPAKWSPLITSSIAQTFNKGYRTVAHEAFELNKTDMANRGTAMANATLTAVLLREVYGGNYGRPKIKLSAVLADDKIPFVAPGLKELFGFGVKTVDGKTEKELIWEPPHDSVKLTLAMRQGGFPNALFLVDKGETLSGWLTIWKLTQQAPPPGWNEPARRPQLPRWRLYLEYRRTCWEDAVTPK